MIMLTGGDIDAFPGWSVGVSAGGLVTERKVRVGGRVRVD